MKPLHKLIRDAAWITTAICAVITAVNFVSNKDFEFLQFVFSKGMLAGFLNGFLLYIGNSLLFRWIRQILPQDIYYGKRILLFIPMTAILTVLVVFIVGFSIKNIDASISLIDFLALQRIQVYFNMIIISMLVSFLIFGFYFYQYYQEHQLNEQMRLTQSAHKQLDLLKSQLDPHFLFNSLNVLNGLIEENPQKAILFTQDLSKIYRYVLEQNTKNLVPVKDEIEFSKSYLNLLSLRFEEGLQSHIMDNIDTEEEKIPPLSLQLLIENCIKHNVISTHKPMIINIYKKNNYLYLSNSLQQKKIFKDSPGIGLQNIKERYLFLTKKPVDIQVTASEFTVGLPIIKNI